MPTTLVNLKDIIVPAVTQEMQANPTTYSSTVPGPRGQRGISVHHTKGTSTTNPLGDFHIGGFIDTYTFYGDADETLNLGWYSVYNGKNSLDMGEIAYYYELNPNTNKYTDAEKSSVDIATTLTTSATTLPTGVNELNLLKFDKAGGVIAGDVTVTGEFTVQGTTTTIDSTTLVVEDKNIELGKVDTPTDDTADGGGVTLLGDTDKTILWKKLTDTWEFSSPVSADLILKTPRVLTFTDDVTGTGTFDGTSDITFSMSVTDNSHNHTIANVTNLQTTLDTLQAGIDSRYLIEEW